MRASKCVLASLAAVTAQSTGQNLFASNPFYVDPNFQQEVVDAMKSVNDSVTLANMQKMSTTATGHWISSKAAVPSVETILADAATKSPAPLVVFVVYNLPNRDCDATNSLGEFCCTTKPDGSCDYLAHGDCSAGLAQYENEFINPIADALKKYADTVPIALILEPSSLPNLATNLKNPACANNATETSYTKGLPLAVNAFHDAAPKASIYIDAAHGGWLGWEANAQAYATLLGTLLVTDKIRGLATNSGNFQPLGAPCPSTAFDDTMHNYCEQGGVGTACCADPCGLLPQYSSGNNEYNYVQALTREIKRAIPYWDPHYLIDTSRNGVTGERVDCAHWCNVRGAGLGHAPSADNLLPTLVDALFWVKTPGESDGCTSTLPDGTQCAQYDDTCGSDDAIGSNPSEPRAPIAGTFWDFYAVSLAEHANFNSSRPITQRATKPAATTFSHHSYGGSAHLAMLG